MQEGETDKEENTGGEGENVEEEVAVVVGCDAIVDPRAVTRWFSTGRVGRNEGDLLIVFGDAAFTALAVLATEWPADHAMFAKIRLVEYP